ncbi:stress-induced protein [Candidatus Parcubacteria bacterium]|jgi:uncharacterized protein|nr:stress-induced protein [Candidatus Parcubacteria bacterium]MBT3948605.1 stress-induced protein [Candidatus Parcubacteria bacterium]
MNNDTTKKQGFATMSSEKRKEIARKGGVAAHTKGSAYKLTSADRSKGGAKSSGNFKYNPDLAREAGKKGGKVSKRGKKK